MRTGDAVNATVLTTLAIRESNDDDNRIQIEANDITMMNLRVGQTAKLQDIGNSRWQQYGSKCESYYFKSWPAVNSNSGVSDQQSVGSSPSWEACVLKQDTKP